MSNTSLLGSYGDNSGSALMFRNVLINGGFDVWQRGTTGASGYVADRWYTVNTSAFAQSTDVPNSVSKYSASLTSSVAFPLLAQRIEGANIRHLAEKQVTISFWAKCTGTHNLYVELGAPVTTEDTFGSYPNGLTTGFSTSVLSASPSSSWTFYSTTVTLPSTVTRGMQIIIGRGNVVAASTTLISQVQIELGPTATPFERRPFGMELALCQRYFETSFCGVPFSYDTTTNGRGIEIGFKVSKRVAPTVTKTTGASLLGGGFSIAAGAEGPTIDRFTLYTAAAGAVREVQFTWKAEAEL